MSTQLYAAIGGAVAMTIAASLVGWLSLNSVGEAQQRVNENSLPETEAASGVAQASSSLAAAAPQLTAATTEAELAAVTARIDEDRANLKTQLEKLEETASEAEGERLQRISGYSEQLDANIEAIKSEVAQALVLAERRDVMSNDLAALRFSLDNTLVPAIDDQLFYTITGYRILGFPPAPEWQHFSEVEVARFRHLADLQANANIATQLLASAFSLSNSSAVEPLRERFESAQGHVNRSLSALQDSLTRTILVDIFADLFNLGLAEGQGLDLIKEGLVLVAVGTL
ncbi:MAG: MCP four helix bundle domain-containing protein, partial [Chloroflexota bacterium]|nr:MCP four helix bundle domain-containing protein [Chloroflexota bacterium]